MPPDRFLLLGLSNSPMSDIHSPLPNTGHLSGRPVIIAYSGTAKSRYHTIVALV
jgi:hypothetical protein